MGTILNFCWQNFSPQRVEGATVQDLRRLAYDAGSRGFVIWDAVRRVTFLAIPELLSQASEVWGVSGGDPAASCGLYDVLPRDQLTVHKSQGAGQVARLAVASSADVVIAVNDDSEPVGVFLPGCVAETLPEVASALGLAWFPRFPRISTAALPYVIDRINDEIPDFHSEQLNTHAPEPYRCPNHGRPHYCSPPCRDHRDVAPIRVRLV